MGAYTVTVGVLLAMVALVCALYGLAALLGGGLAPLRGDPYMSGIAPVEHAASRYHLRWYPVTLLFLAFDMEMVFMYPWSVVVAQVGVSAVIEMFGFLAILLLGVGYAYREGALRWV